MTLDVKTENGTDKRTYKSYAAFEADYLSGAIHPNDLKPAVATYINRLLQPVRSHFTNDPYARKLLETIKRWQQEVQLR
jgi:tyrosyl-tRNA synthetase